MDPPVLRCVEVKQKLNAVEGVCKPIVTRPAPPPPKQEEAKGDAEMKGGDDTGDKSDKGAGKGAGEQAA